MIISIRHKGLLKFFETGSTVGIQSKHAELLEDRLAALNTTQSIDDMSIPGYRLHPLKDKMKGRWSIKVSGNWRLTFEFRQGDVHVLDYEDYH
ncbi:MAG: type II toxin-antitoxin system RelE/ParE family toxin [Cyanobacteria bacterium J06650_10]